MDSRKLFGLKRIEQVKIDRARLEAVAPRDERGQEVSNRPAYQADIKGSTTEKKDTAIATDKDATPSKPDASSQDLARWLSALKYQSIEEVINDVLDLKDNLQREHPEIAMQSDYGIWEKMPRDNEQITWAQRKEVVTLVRGKVKHVLSIYQDQYIAKEKNMNTRGTLDPVANRIRIESMFKQTFQGDLRRGIIREMLVRHLLIPEGRVKSKGRMGRHFAEDAAFSSSTAQTHIQTQSNEEQALGIKNGYTSISSVVQDSKARRTERNSNDELIRILNSFAVFEPSAQKSVEAELQSNEQKTPTSPFQKTSKSVAHTSNTSEIVKSVEEVQDKITVAEIKGGLSKNEREEHRLMIGHNTEHFEMQEKERQDKLAELEKERKDRHARWQQMDQYFEKAPLTDHAYERFQHGRFDADQSDNQGLNMEELDLEFDAEQIPGSLNFFPTFANMRSMGPSTQYLEMGPSEAVLSMEDSEMQLKPGPPIICLDYWNPGLVEGAVGQEVDREFLFDEKLGEQEIEDGKPAKTLITKIERLMDGITAGLDVPEHFETMRPPRSQELTTGRKMVMGVMTSMDGLGVVSQIHRELVNGDIFLESSEDDDDEAQLQERQEQHEGKSQRFTVMETAHPAQKGGEEGQTDIKTEKEENEGGEQTEGEDSDGRSMPEDVDVGKKGTSKKKGKHKKKSRSGKKKTTKTKKAPKKKKGKTRPKNPKASVPDPDEDEEASSQQMAAQTQVHQSLNEEDVKDEGDTMQTKSETEDEDKQDETGAVEVQHGETHDQHLQEEDGRDEQAQLEESDSAVEHSLATLVDSVGKKRHEMERLESTEASERISKQVTDEQMKESNALLLDGLNEELVSSDEDVDNDIEPPEDATRSFKSTVSTISVTVKTKEVMQPKAASKEASPVADAEKTMMPSTVEIPTEAAEDTSTSSDDDDDELVDTLPSSPSREPQDDTTESLQESQTVSMPTISNFDVLRPSTPRATVPQKPPTPPREPSPPPSTPPSTPPPEENRITDEPEGAPVSVPTVQTTINKFESTTAVEEQSDLPVQTQRSRPQTAKSKPSSRRASRAEMAAVYSEFQEKLQKRLIQIWIHLGTSTESKLQMIQKYTTEAYAAHLSDALFYLEQAVELITRREAMLTQLQQIHDQGQKNYRDLTPTLQQDIDEISCQVREVLEYIENTYDDPVVFHDQLYLEKMATDCQQLLTVSVAEENADEDHSFSSYAIALPQQSQTGNSPVSVRPTSSRDVSRPLTAEPATMIRNFPVKEDGPLPSFQMPPKAGKFLSQSNYQFPSHAPLILSAAAQIKLDWMIWQQWERERKDIGDHAEQPESQGASAEQAFRLPAAIASGRRATKDVLPSSSPATAQNLPIFNAPVSREQQMRRHLRHQYQQQFHQQQSQQRYYQESTSRPQTVPSGMHTQQQSSSQLPQITPTTPRAPPKTSYGIRHNKIPDSSRAMKVVRDTPNMAIMSSNRYVSEMSGQIAKVTTGVKPRIKRHPPSLGGDANVRSQRWADYSANNHEPYFSSTASGPLFTRSPELSVAAASSFGQSHFMLKVNTSLARDIEKRMNSKRGKRRRARGAQTARKTNQQRQEIRGFETERLAVDRDMALLQYMRYGGDF